MTLIETWEVVYELAMPDSVNVKVRKYLERKDGASVIVTGNLMCFDKRLHAYVARNEEFSFTYDDLQEGRIEARTKVEFR